ncbi:hypothetical protein Esti_002082 [Eimeria stiedai]
MGFDRYRREDPSRPNYRFFPNRTRAQTRILSWGILGVGAFMTVFFLKAFEVNNEKLKRYYDQLAVHNPRSPTQAQVDAQNDRLTEIFYKARRADLRLPEKPRLPMQIEDDDEAP